MAANFTKFTPIANYTSSFKLSVVTKAEDVDNREAARIYSIDESTVRGWKKIRKHWRNATDAVRQPVEASRPTIHSWKRKL